MTYSWVGVSMSNKVLRTAPESTGKRTMEKMSNRAKGGVETYARANISFPIAHDDGSAPNQRKTMIIQ